MNIRLLFSGSALAVALLGLAGPAAAQEPAQDYFFLPGANDPAGDFNVDANWANLSNPPDNFRPSGAFNEVATIDSGGTAFLDVVLPGDGPATGRGPGELTVSSGRLEIRNTGSLTLAEPDTNPMVSRSVAIGDVLNIQGAGALNASSISFGSGATYDLDLTGGTVAPITIEGSATLGGSLELDFSGFGGGTGSIGILSAGLVIGDFDQVSATGLAAGQGVSVEKIGITGVQATVSNVLSLRIDRPTGNVFLENTHATPISIDGYQVQSDSGALFADALNSLGAGWESPVGNGANSIAEVFEGPNVGTPADSIAANSSVMLGNIYVGATPTEFLQEVEDVQLVQTGPDGTFNGPVTYEGDGRVENNIVLTIDSNGDASLLNTSIFSQQVEAYRISSSDGALSVAGWNSLADSGADDGTWGESAQSDSSMLLEVQEGANPGSLGNDNSTTFDFNTLFEIGAIYTGGSSEQDGVTFEYLIAGESSFTQGAVVFGDLPSLTLVGDYNEDGAVDAADYTVWRDNLGTLNGLPNRAPGVFGAVSQTDYDQWAANYGRTLGVSAAAVPEPVSLLAATSCLLLGLAGGRRG